MNALETMVALMERLEQSTENAGLGIPVILGFPELGRPDVTLPIAAVTFSADDYAQPGKRRIGQTEPAGRIVQGTLHVFAGNERQLLTLVDALHESKKVIASLAVSGTVVKISFGGTRRTDYGSDERQLAHAAATDFVCLKY